MKNYLHIIVFLLYTCCNLYGQQVCNCEKEFLFVKGFVETNYAGFSDKVTDLNKQNYSELSENLLQQTKSASTLNHCYFVIQSFLNYFKDGHLRLIYNPKSINKLDIENLLLGTETVSELKGKPLTDIEGIYTTPSKSYEIALVKNTNTYRDYVGVILNTKVKSWEKGQVKIELKHIEDDKYQGIFYFKDHHPEIINYTIKNGKFYPEDFVKVDIPQNKTKEKTEPFDKFENSNKVVFYKDIDDSTAYIRIKSFDDHFAKQVADVIKANETKLKSKPYLIIDVRYNGGGSDFSYTPILPFIYTNPIKTIGVDVYSTPDNIKSWQKVVDENPHLPENVRKSLNDIITKMKENPNKLVSLGNDETYTLNTVYTFPRKVAVLIDNDCASSTEQFLLTAKQSTKIVLMGQHTAGVLDYSNMRMVNLDCMPYILGYSTTRSRRVPENAIDNTGVLPDIEIDFDKVWLQTVLNNLK